MKRIQTIAASSALLVYAALSFAFDAKSMINSLPVQTATVLIPAKKAEVESPGPGTPPTSATVVVAPAVKPTMLKSGATIKSANKAVAAKAAGASDTGAAEAKPTASSKPLEGSSPVVPVVDPAVIAQRRSEMDALVKYYDNLVAVCEGRYGVLESRLKKQTIRAETISIYGGLIGVMGAVATCPHCAAFASALAGLANPMQQTFKENSDTPADTIGELKTLSDSIKADFNAYQALPAPQVYSGGDDDFSSKWQARRDKLVAITLSCDFFARSAAKAGEAPAPAAAPKTNDAAPTANPPK